MEWDDLKTFLSVGREGTLSAAARALGVTQTTVGRRLEALHRRVGVRLLQKTTHGYILTPAGDHILENVEAMEAEALAVELAVTGEDVRLSGTVRVSTVEPLALRLLAPSVAELQRHHPNIQLEIRSDSRTISLSRHEADIALRLGKFDQPAIVARKVGEVQNGVFASPAYLEHHGPPDFARYCEGHRKISAHTDMVGLPNARWFETVSSRATVALRCEILAMVEAARAGVGLACLPTYLVQGVPDLVRVESPKPPVREMWLGVHRDLHRTPRIRVVLDHIAASVRHAGANLGALAKVPA